MLHLTKVAVACADVEVLRDRLAGRAIDGETFVDTRYRPTRHLELIGGSLYWILPHRFVARSRILRFDEGERGRCLIRLDVELVSVTARPKRVHQGWRYLAGADAPADLTAGEGDIAALPARLATELTALMLI